MNPRLYRLIEKHQRIDEALHRARQRRGTHWTEIVRLKKLKLKVKDLIARFTRKAARL